jgi:YVTN family beta-propeller protein
MSEKKHCPSIVFLLFVFFASACATVTPPQPVNVNNRVYVANESGNSLSVIDAVSLKPLRTVDFDLKGAHDLALTRDGRTLFVTNLLSGTVTVVDTTNFEIIATIPTGNRAHSLALTNDERQLWVVNIGENNISVIDIERLRILGTISAGRLPGHVRFSKDGRYAYVTSQEDGRVIVIDTSNHQTVKSIAVGKLPHFIITSPDGQYLWGGNTGGREVYVIDMAKNERVGWIDVGSKPQHIGFGMRGMFGPFAYVAVEDADEVVVIDTTPGGYKVVDRIKVESKPSGIGASPEGGRIYVGVQGTDEVQVIDTGTHRVIARIPVGIKPVGVLPSYR